MTGLKPLPHKINNLHPICKTCTLCMYFAFPLMKKNIQVRLDEKLKNKAEKIFKRIGIDMPTAVRMFFIKVTDVGGIPFSLLQDEFEDHYTPEQIEALDAFAEEAWNDPNLAGPFSSTEDLIKSLRS